MKKILFILFVLALATSMFGATIHTNDCSAATAGWTYTNGGGIAIQQGGYWLGDNVGDYIISQAFDVSGYTALTLTFKVGTYGSGTNNPCKVEYSADNGSTWSTTTFTSITPTSSTLTAGSSWAIGTVNATQLKLRWSFPGGGAKGVRLDDILFTGTPSVGTPIITTVGTLSSFTASHGTPSIAKTYTVAGSNLTANISVAPPAGYEVSFTEGSGYTITSLSIPFGTGTVAATTIYARMTGTTVGAFSGNIVNSSTGAVSANIAVTGTVYKAEPTSHVTGFDAITATPPYSAVYMAWTDATGATTPDGYLIKGSAISLGSIVAPVDATAEANSALVQNVAFGIQEATFYDLASNTTYYFKVFPYTNSGANINYKTDGTVANTSVLTEYGPPAIPTANSATAISHDGFTARWETVGGATSYRLDVLSGAAAIATDLFISEYYEGSTGTNKYIEIFNGTGSSVDLSNYSIRKQANGVGDFSSDFPLLGTLANNSVWVVAHSSSNATILAAADQTKSSSPLDFNGNDCVALYKNSVQIDVVGIIGQVTPDWGANVTLVRNSSISSPNISWSLSDWTSYPSETTTYLGSHTMSNSLAPVVGYNDLPVTGNLKRVTGLYASTDYSYRVRAYNGVGTSANSNAIVLSTTASTPGTTANTTIGGVSTVFTVPIITGYTNLGVEIDPDTITNDDFSVVVAEIATGLTYTINTSNDLALNGVYLLNHAGFGSAPTLTSNIGTIVVDANEATGSIVTISGIPAAKGVLVITAEDNGGTLPVELSSFTATISAQNFVRLMWVTESETNVNGYYIYRGLTDDVSAALLVSEMITATNTSQQTSYMYTDKEVYEDGVYYYWLQNSDIDGSSEMHGPVFANVTLNSGNTTPGLPLVTALQSVYPNPFNPSTFVRFSIANPISVKIDIYNVRGQLVRSLLNADKAVGNHRIEWNGKDDNGISCTNGIYYIKMQAGKDSFVRKSVMLK